jgi:protein gp37
MMKTERVKLSEITRDPELQVRMKLDHELATTYAEDMLAGCEFPPVRLFHDGTTYWLSQGWHRVLATEWADELDIMAEIIDGTRDDALWDAIGSNREHDKAGKKRSNADKRRAIEMALAVKPKRSNRSIAGWIGVSDHTVAKIEAASAHMRTGQDWKIAQAGRILGINQNGHGTGPLPGQTSFLDDLPDPDPPVAVPVFNQTNEMVDWARWTWNPVTGCEHNCFYCYARDIANRFYDEKFTPTYRPERLEAPRNTKLPGAALQEADPVQRTAWKNVFVCSMADLFGRWVPDEWINGVFDSCRQSPEWNYLWLTKFPLRYADLDFPPNSWVGTTVDEQKRVINAEKAFRNIISPVKWLSCEPMLEPLRFNDLSVFNWVVIGGCSASTGGPQLFPDRRWVLDLITQSLDAGCKVYCKENISSSKGWAREFKDYPDVFYG